MTKYEKQLNAIMRCLAAETDNEREVARDEVRTLLKAPAPTFVKKDAETVIREILLDLGVPEHLKGHPYLVTALMDVVEKPSLINAITKELYPQVAEAFQTTPSRVERAIRHAIEVAWDRGDLEVLNSYFGNTVSWQKGKPTNSEFIGRIANVVRQRIKEAA